MSNSFKAGYSGKDTMRSNAEKMFGKAEMSTNMSVPESYTAKDREKTRMYKKGGHVMHKASKEQTDMHIPRQKEGHVMKQKNFEKVQHNSSGYKKGGHTKKNCFDEGGMVPDQRPTPFGATAAPASAALPSPNPTNPMVTQPYQTPTVNMKRGGHAKKKCYADGGEVPMPGSSPMSLPPQSANRMAPQQSIAQPSMSGGQDFFEKLKATKPPGGGVAPMLGSPMGRGQFGQGRRFADGGGVYESEMVGEHSSRKRPHNNYESHMVGEHGTPRKLKRGGDVYERQMVGEHATRKRKAMGGAMSKAMGGETKLAMGGVGKIRHKQSTAKGTPKG